MAETIYGSPDQVQASVMGILCLTGSMTSIEHHGNTQRELKVPESLFLPGLAAMNSFEILYDLTLHLNDLQTFMKMIRPRVLIIDGFTGHSRLDFIEYCIMFDILLVIFPPYSTHTLQPLDVGVFQPLKSAQ